MQGIYLGAICYQLKCLVNLLIAELFSFNPFTGTIGCFNFDGSDNEEDKEELINAEAMPINVSEISGDGSV